MRRLRLVSITATLAGVIPGCTDDAAGSAADDADPTGGIDPTAGDDMAGSESVDESGDDDDDATGFGSGEGGSGGDGSCEDGFQSGMETDVDCGGPDCGPCEPPANCEEDSDCTTMVCTDGECQVPTCYDDIQNGNESGVDCGGGCPTPCLPGAGPCDEDWECDDDEFCMEGDCVPSSCRNEIIDSGETDVDCGGPDCPACDDGAECVFDAHCESLVCEDGVCLEPTCEDGETNGDETDEDCGGPDCDPCPNGATCAEDDDCVSGACVDDSCTAPSCDDDIQNQDETDVDCGGLLCDPCEDDAECVEADDCESGVCDVEMGVCLAPTCEDGVHNGDETDADCGNSCGMNTCEVDESCDDDTDCVEEVCEFTVCSAPDCLDGVQNGDETGIDCGEASGCGACPDDEGCLAGIDCESGVCDVGLGVCLEATCMDDVLNGDETDTDCGNSCGATCIPGEICDSPGDCTTGVCDIGECADAACDDDVLNGDEVDVDCGGTCPQPCTIDDETTVNTETDDYQTSPAMAVAPDGSFWVVVWTSTGTGGDGQDGEGGGIFGQMYDDAGPLGGEFLVNSTTDGNQTFADVAAYNNGFVVVWQSDGDLDGDLTGVFAQRYDAAGIPLGGEDGINETTDGAQRRPSVAMSNTGDYVVCWDGQDVDFDAFCRRFAADGTALAGEVMINAGNTASDQLPVVARRPAGDYVVVWQTSNGVDGEGVGVFMRGFADDGSETIAQDQVNSVTDGDQSEPTVAMANGGDFVVSWTGDGIDSGGTGIAMQRFDSNGTPQGGEVPVNTTEGGSQQRSAIGMAGDGAYVVVWQTPQDGDTTGIFGQRYQANGVEIGEEFIVNPTVSERQEDPDVGVRLGSEIISVWTYGDELFTTSNIQTVRYDGGL